MLMTKEALKESYVLHNESMQSSGSDDGSLWIFMLGIVLIICMILFFVSIATDSMEIFLIGCTAIFIIGAGVFMITGLTSNGDDIDKEERELQYKINTVMPYLFKNAETADTLKRYDNIDIQIDQEELFKTGVIMGQVVVNDNGNEIIYPFKQVTLGVTSTTDSYMEVNELDVELSEEYPLGKTFNVLYLNNDDYTMFMNLFGEIPIRIEK